MKKSTKPSPSMQVARDYWRQLKHEKALAIPTFILPGIGTILVFYTPPLIIATLIQKFVNNEVSSTSDLIPYVLAFSGIWALGELIWRLTIHLMIKLEIRSINRLYVYAMEEILKRDLSFFHDNFAGSMTKKTIAYARKFENFVDTLVFNVVSSIPPLIFISYVLWQYSPWLVLGLVGMIGLTLLFVIPLILRRQKLVISREAASNVMSGHISDIYSNIDAVRAFASEDQELRTHKKYVNDLMVKSKRSWDYQNRRIDIVTSPMYVLTNLIGLLLALQLGNDNPNNIAAIFVTFSYYAGFTRIMWEFNRIYRDIESALSEAGEFTELLDNSAPTIIDPKEPVEYFSNEGNVAFKNVTFSYQEDGSQALFENFDLTIKAGEKVGLVGHSGGGKSTITKLLLRFVDVDAGVIEIDNVNICDLTQKTLRQFISYVPQEPAMFHRSLKDNICYGKPGSGMDEVKSAADKAHASEFIEKLPEKYDTLIGERGIKLSGGQRQRVAIARAMLKDAPILVLDEATSALDSESEKLIQDALWKLMEGKTAIVIAHRLSTIQKMDRIIVLDDGAIAEEGSHQKLLENNDIYAKLWSHQSGGFLED